MKIGVLGTGTVGVNLASKLVEIGHQVKMGSRTPDNINAMSWAQKNGSNASYGTFADAAAFGEIVFNCTSGEHSMEALKSAGEKNLEGKILVDVANPIKFENGELELLVSNTDSLGEQIQRAFPKAKVVKALNTASTELQVNPSRLRGDHDLFICGNDDDAKSRVAKLLKHFGWKSVVDIGGIKASRGMEALLLLWIHLSKKRPNELFNYKIIWEKEKS
ncbi:MAG: NAD(P)-binding domain-containing protein [Candidatus Marsarchaeota archaeon]|jgi:predicted dinucleotide-binding enzyme|nr:NAD(P)-binding domain-containing protein [Candidatus Marsarchaeota archaeon]